MKVGGAYDSVVRGVSEQVAHDRRPGQHHEQVNMISDPVRGLARRHGSVWQDEISHGVLYDYEQLRADHRNMKEFSFVIDGLEYSLLYRDRASTGPAGTFMYLYNKVTDKFMPVNYDGSPWVNALIAGGVSAITCAGRYLYIAGHDTIPSATLTNRWDNPANNARMVVWIRGGAYSRSFTVKLSRPDGTVLSVSYKTKGAAYPELLDTSDISFYETDGTTPREDYQKDINDRVNAYNSAATAYIGEAAADITGENIAQKLVDLLVAEGVAASREDSTVVIDDADFLDVAADDGGDNTLMRAVGSEVTAPTLMSTVHYVGKVVRIRPLGASDKETYFLEAYAKDDVSTGWSEVIWRESSGILQNPTTIFSMGVIHNGTLKIGMDGYSLDILAPGIGEHPKFATSRVGDANSSPTPNFFGGRITMLAVFQDRLLIGSGGTINTSRSGDYFNFFRQTVLNIMDDDPIEMYAYGSEGDVLRHAVMYDKDLIIFGDLYQYAISGRAVLTAKAPLVALISAHENAGAARPRASGNFVFYGKHGESRTSMHQLRIGELTASPVSDDVSAQLDTYLKGTPVQLLTLTAPNAVLMRTDAEPNVIYTFMYLDSQSERLIDSWSRWEYEPVLGEVCGMTSYEGNVITFHFREGALGYTYTVADKQSMRTALSQLPYLDSARKYTGLGGWHDSVPGAWLCSAADRTHQQYLLGTPFADVDLLVLQVPDIVNALWVGACSPAYVEPTNPYVRDQNGKAMLNGRTTINTLRPNVVRTSDITGSVYTVNGDDDTLVFEGRVMGNSLNTSDVQPLYTGQLTMGAGREVREFKYRLSSSQWGPMTLVGIDWVGQRFNRIR
jgi:hypothetical protein